MTTYRSILKLVWPLALGMVNNAVMQFADRTYLAHSSLAALEAVLPAGILMWIFAGFFQSVVGYSSVFVGQYHGAGDEAGCRACYRAARWIAVVSGVLMLPLVPVGEWVLAWSTTSAETLALEKTYYDITLLGGFFVYGQMAAASYFTGRGHTRIVFWVNLLGNVLNIALDPLLIFGTDRIPAMGIAGAAYATVFSMAVQWVVLEVVARRSVQRDRNVASPLTSQRKGDATFLSREANHAAASKGDATFLSREKSLDILFRILRFGVPSGLYTILNMLSFTIFVFVTGGVGKLELAVSNACFTINYLLIAPMEGFALGASTLVAQAIGRGDRDDADRAARRSLILGVGFTIAISALVLVFARPVLGLFAAKAGETSAEFYALGGTLLLLMAGWLVFDAADIILSGALKGAGDTRFVMTWLLVIAFALWLPVVFVVRHFHNTMPALWSTMIGYVFILFVGSVLRWRRGTWRRISIV